ncbi:MAG: glutamine synthetase family protein, partial [Alphaproteobacteria bacterium]|nr:glutamine synthetase family protein [Alphaproteobacteria bacterium]
MNVQRPNRSDEPGASPLDAAALEAFLQENQSIQYVDCVFADLCGAVRGKRIARADLVRAFTSGLQIPGTIYFLDARGDASDPTAPTTAPDASHATAWPVPGTLTRVNWSQRSHGQVLMTLVGAQGEPFFGEPRNVLRRVVDRFADLELVPAASTKFEFYLLDRERSKAGLPHALKSAGAGNGEREVLSEIAEAAAVQLLPAIASAPLPGEGQYQIAFKDAAAAVRAGDHAVFLRQVVRAVARQNGIDASFMAKPFLDLAGSGLNAEITIKHRGGKNVFDDGTPKGSDLMRFAIGGLQAVMAESIALFAPNVNAYRRFVSNAAFPRNKKWGYSKASTNIRVPAGPGPARRIEHSVASADANPYLVIAAVLAGIHHGISHQIDPGQPFDGNANAF